MSNTTLQFERTSDQGLTYIRVGGTVDESFDGRGTAARISSDSTRLVINCSGIRMITSFGIRGWGEFIAELERRKIDLYYVECSPMFVNELNQVVHFASHGLVVSVNAPYECPECKTARQVLLRMDRDADIIRDRLPPDYSCLVCGSQLEFDDEPAQFFPGLDAHLDGRIDKDVRAFLEARLGYEGKQERLLGVLKVVEGDTTVLMLSGTLDGSLDGGPLTQGLEGEVVVDLSGVLHVQRAGLKAWADFLVEVARRVQTVWIVASPTLILERALDPGLSDQVGVLSVQVPYHCQSCDATEFESLSLASRAGEKLRSGNMPTKKCSSCSRESTAMIGAGLLQTMQEFPAIKMPGSVSKALKKAAKQLKSVRQKRTEDPSAKRPMGFIAAAAALVLVGVGLVGVGAMLLLKSQDGPPVRVAKGQEGVAQGVTAAAARPSWIISDRPSQSYCTDVGRQVYCVGVSSYSASVDEGTQEGLQGAVEAFAHFALLNDTHPAIAAQRTAYVKQRSSATQALEQALLDGKGAADAQQKVRAAKKNVFDLVQRQSPPGAPTQRSDLYWEEFKKEGTVKGTEFLVFVRVDISETELEAFAKHYGTAVAAGGAKFTPMLPGMAWLFDVGGDSGVYANSVAGGAMASAGVKKGDLLLGEMDVLTSGANLLGALMEGLDRRRGEAFQDKGSTTNR